MINNFSVPELRSACRHFVPESRGFNKLAHTGSKEDLAQALIDKNINSNDIENFLNGENKDFNQKIETNNKGEKLEVKEKAEHDDKNTNELELLRKIILKDNKAEINEDKVKELIDSRLNVLPVIRYHNKETEKIETSLCHKETNNIIKIIMNDINIMLTGPAGSGKSKTCKIVSSSLGLDFFPISVGLQTSKSDILGYMNASGEYVTTPARQAYEHGGLLMLDEFDATHAGIITIINGMLANDVCGFPDKTVKKHKDFRVIACCNTYGRGGDNQYIGRNQLDASTLDRFIVLDFDYDEELENKLVNDKEVTARIQRYRRTAERLKERVIISPRASINAKKLKDAGFDWTFIEKNAIFKGIDYSIIARIKQV